MKASILIPAFNAERTLRDTLESCVLQGESAVEEIIVVDDHSKDETSSVFHNVSKQNPEFTWVWSQNPKKGACSARNHAFQLSKGHFIQWLDADDILGKNKIETQIKILENSPNSIAACPFQPFQGSPTTKISHSKKIWDIPPSSSKEDWLAADTMIGTHGWLAPRSITKASGLWDESLLINQDGEFFCRGAAMAQTIFFDDSVEVYYRKEGGGVSKFSAAKADSLFRSIQLMQKTALAIEDSARMRRMISNRFQSFIWTAYPHAKQLRKQARRHLQHLPKPNIANPIAISPLSKTICQTLGWKTLTQLRLLRNRIL